MQIFAKNHIVFGVNVFNVTSLHLKNLHLVILIGV